MTDKPTDKRGYRPCEPLNSDTIPREALRGPSPQLMSVNADELTTGTTRGNLTSMLDAIPEGTKRQIGM